MHQDAVVVVEHHIIGCAMADFQAQSQRLGQFPEDRAVDRFVEFDLPEEQVAVVRVIDPVTRM